MNIGGGCFSKVIKVEDKYAQKIIDVDSQRKPHNWRVEISALKTLADSPHIVSVLKVEEQLHKMEPEVRILMPFYEMTLEHVIYAFAKANYPVNTGWRNVMPEWKIKQIFSGLASALEYIHSHRIIHRDLKPENVLFHSLESGPVLIDFGISWIPGGPEPEQSKEIDVSTGEFKAPELLYGLRSYTEKIDLWSLGCIIARLLTPDCVGLFTPYKSDIQLISSQFLTLGKPALLDCPSLQDTTASHLLSEAQDPKHPAQFRMDNELSTLTRQLLAFEPSARPSASALLGQL